MQFKKTVSIVGFAVGSFSSLWADIEFQFDYSKSVEFSSGPLAEARQESLEHAAFLLGSQFVDQATITIEVTSENDPNSDTLATAGSEFVDAPDDFFGFFPAVIERKVLEGVDDNGAAPDGGVTVNFGVPWDLDDSIAFDEFDFKATIIHELLHALGFSSGIDADGADVYGTLPGEAGVWSLFDEYVSDRLGQRLIDANFALDGNLWTETSIGGRSPAAGLFFAGPETLLVNGNAPVGLFSPDPWSGGSSGSHLDDDNPELEGFLMLAATEEGPYTRQLSTIERAMLTDLGYTLKPAPVDPAVEPGSETTGNSEAFEVFIELEDETVYVTVEGDPGNYQIEVTEDFETWESVAVLSIDSGQTEATLEDDVFEFQFYRATRE